MAGGDYRIICDYSGFKIWKSEARMTWDGWLVKKEFWEARPMQDFVRGIKDDTTVPVARPEQDDFFVDPGTVKRGDL